VSMASSSVQLARTPPVGFEAILASGGGGSGNLDHPLVMCVLIRMGVFVQLCAPPPHPPRLF
jgi:hypothetical protein